jgi:ABC-type dipeptide/oligopeptide/nickel transport system permease component
MTAPRALAELSRRVLRLAMQALGVVLLLFIILESGVAGDPAERALGDRPSVRRLGELRVELGYLRSFQAEALRLRLNGAPARLTLKPHPDGLQLLALDGSLLATLPVAGISVTDFAANLRTLALPQSMQLEAELRGEGIGSLPASGLRDALQNSQLAIDSRLPAVLPWAESRPGWQRFLVQCGELLRFDFGRSLDGQLVGRQLRERGARSLSLALPALILGSILALAAAIYSARRAGLPGDRRLLRLGAFVIAVSGVSWVLVFRSVFAAQLEWFPVVAWDPPSFSSLLLPISIWAFLAAWPDHQIYRRILISESQAGHVLAARARGLAARELWLRHVLRSGSAALLAHFVLALPFLVLGSLILEQIFVVPGLGAYLVDAARNADAAVLRAATFLLALIYLVAQELGDWLTGRLDPRFRSPGALR